MIQLLAGDIGGTKTLLRLFEVNGEDVGTELTPRLGHPLRNPLGNTLAEAEYPSQRYPDLVPMVEQFLQESRVVSPRPQGACFALAGPVVNQTCQLTNLSWTLRSDRLQRDLNIPQVKLINDFVAVGYGVLGLTATDLCYLQNAPADPMAPIGVLGAGTGLGECFLVPLGNGQYQAYPTEGGHADFAPRSLLEFELRQYILHQENIDRVSVERVVSGQGIISIYQFLRDTNKASESIDIAQSIRAWEAGTLPTLQPAELIAQGSDRDELCRLSMELFMDAYAVEAGNLALKLLPYGGLYLAGGIAAKNLTWVKNDRFLGLLREKGRVSRVLDGVPIAVTLNPQVGLIGAVIYAQF
ncbi:MAG: glucokinase [Prochlorotrichaceae cyanobacterium]